MVANDLSILIKSLRKKVSNSNALISKYENEDIYDEFEDLLMTFKKSRPEHSEYIDRQIKKLDSVGYEKPSALAILDHLEEIAKEKYTTENNDDTKENQLTQIKSASTNVHVTQFEGTLTKYLSEDETVLANYRNYYATNRRIIYDKKGLFSEFFLMWSIRISPHRAFIKVLGGAGLF